MVGGLGAKKQVRFILKYLRVWFQCFSPHVKILTFSKYVSPKLEPAGPDSPSSYTFLFKKSCQKWVKNIIFSHIFKLIFGFYVFSSVNQWDWPVYHKKTFRNVPRQHFLAHFMPKIDQNKGISLILQNARYLKITARTFSKARNVR